MVISNESNEHAPQKPKRAKKKAGKTLVKRRHTKARKSLNARQRKFCELIVDGSSQARAYLDAGYQLSKPDYAWSHSSRLIRNGKIQAYIEELRKDAETSAVCSLAEKRQFLAQIIRTPIGEVDENSPLAQEKTVRHEGEGATVEKIKMMSKADAIKLDNQLAGHGVGDGRGVHINNTVVNQTIQRTEEEQDAFLERKERIRERLGIEV